MHYILEREALEVQVEDLERQHTGDVLTCLCHPCCERREEAAADAASEPNYRRTVPDVG